MSEQLCEVCGISAARVLRREPEGIVALPGQTVRDGHVMVVSASHAASFSDLPPASAAAFLRLVGEAAREAEGATGSHCYVVRIGDQAPHLHFHIVPRIASDPALAPYVFGDGGWGGAARGGNADV